MSESPRLIQHGSVGGTAINVDMTHIDHSAPVRIRLTAAYTMLHPPGIPSRPGMTGASAANLDYPRTVANGTTLTLLKGEADALVTAGAAVYV
ncbi:MAG: hypothetical protein ACYDAE_25295 [Steroidobacteraceae bacterium]